MGLEELPEGDDLGAKLFLTSFIIKNIVRLGGFFSVGDLVGEALAGVGFGGFAGGAGGGEARDVAGNFQVVWRGDEDDAIDAAAPIGEPPRRRRPVAGGPGEHAFSLASGSGVADNFKDKS